MRLADLRVATGDVTPHKDDDGFDWHGLGTKPRPAILAFDVGDHLGWALLSQGAGFQCGTIERGDSRIDRAWVQAVLDLTHRLAQIGLGETGLVVVEDAYYSKSVAVTAHLARIGGAIMALATLHGLPSLRVQPPVWQSAILGKARRDQGKALSLARARQTFGTRVTCDHEADAALLALYARGANVPGTRPRPQPTTGATP